MRIAKELAGFSGAKADDLRKAIGKKNRAAMAKGSSPSSSLAPAPAGTSDAVIEFLLDDKREVGGLLVQPKATRACYALIAYRTGVAGRRTIRPSTWPALISSVMSTKGPRCRSSSRRCEEMGNRDPAARREPLRPTSSRSSIARSRFGLGRRSRASLPGRFEAESRGPADEAARFSSDLGISASASTVARSTRRAIGGRSSSAVALGLGPGATRRGHAPRFLEQGAGRPARKAQAGRADRPGARSSISATPAPRFNGHAAIRPADLGRSSSTSANCSRSRRRRSGCSSPSTR